MDEALMYFNGVNGVNGHYLLPPLSPRDVVTIARGETIDPTHLRELKSHFQRATEATYGPVAGVDTKKIEQAGWGVIFANNADPLIRDALLPLLEHRKKQATKVKETHFREFVGEKGYRAGESKLTFLARHGAGPGPADPENVPYYLLIVGDPETIPYRFQYQLDVQYAVGRIWFDTHEEYARYAKSVIQAESGAFFRPREAFFFGPANPDDRATQLSAAELVKPLADELPGKLMTGQASWTVHTAVGTDATKAQLAQILGGSQTPALLFTASHGMGFPAGDDRQHLHQGALLCQDWPGPVQWRRSIPEEHYFHADDVGDDADLRGLIAFHFACYGAGTPRLDDFAHQVFKQPTVIAPRAFVARLPCRMLGHPKGGALAVIGHVERAWGYSFQWSRAGRQIQCFESALKSLMEGYPIGAAMEFFNERYAELSSHLADELEDIKFGKIPDEYGLAAMWTANNDARSYIILGDPAVRIPLEANS